jgi:hypothetical protein
MRKISRILSGCNPQRSANSSRDGSRSSS